MKAEIQNIATLLNSTYEKGAWHGPSVKEVLADLTQATAHKRINNSHSIIELIAHMASWRIYVAERLIGNNDFEVGDHLNFPKIDKLTEALFRLETSQQKLMAAIGSFPEEKLTDVVPNTSHNYTYYTLLHGIIHHDLYHAGQIQIIKKYV
jgi:uncharacterized damage-inducible protein DinB